MTRNKETTWTTLVLETLIGRDDFMTYEMLREATGGNQNQIAAACHHLRNRRAIDCIIQPEGVAWWYATPDTDNRIREVKERRREEIGSRKRRKLRKLTKESK